MGRREKRLRMGAGSSSPGLTRDDLEFLQRKTSFDKETILDFYKGFIADCPDGKLSFLLLVLKIFVRFTANAFRVEILGNFVIMYLEHLIPIKMGSLISKNFSFQLMLHQPEHRRKNSSGLSECMMLTEMDG